MEKTERNVGLDLLKIIAMLMIVGIHYLGHGQIFETLNDSSINYYIALGLKIFFIVSVNCFVLVSGYFLVNSKFNYKKIIKLWQQTLFYSLIIGVVLIIVQKIIPDKMIIINSLFPIISKLYWFVTVYIGLYLLSPFLNILIKKMDRKTYKQLILIILLLFCIIPTIIPMSWSLDASSGYGIIWFICLYFIAGYIRLYVEENSKKENRLNILKYIIFVSAMIILRVIYSFMISKYKISNHYEGAFTAYNSILVLLPSIYLFMYFKNIKITHEKCAKLITIISPLTFGVYLIHDNRYLRTYIYEFLNAKQMVNSPYFIVVMIISIIAIFSLCILIEWGRKFLFDKFENSKLGKQLNQIIDNKYQIIKNKIIKKKIFFLESDE